MPPIALRRATLHLFYGAMLAIERSIRRLAHAASSARLTLGSANISRLPYSITSRALIIYIVKFYTQLVAGVKSTAHHSSVYRYTRPDESGRRISA